MKAFVLYLIRIYRALLPQWLRHLVPANLRRSLHQRVRRASLKHALPMLRKGKQDMALRIVNVFAARAMKRPEKMSAEAYCVCCEVLRRSLCHTEAERLVSLGLVQFPESAKLWKEAALVAREARNYENAAERWERFFELNDGSLSPRELSQVVSLYISMRNHRAAHELCTKALELNPAASEILISRALNLGQYVIYHFNALHLEKNEEYAARIYFEVSASEVIGAFADAFQACDRSKNNYRHLRKSFVNSYCLLRHLEPTLKGAFDSMLLDAVFDNATSRDSALCRACTDALSFSGQDRGHIHEALHHALAGDFLSLGISSTDLRYLERVLLWTGFWEIASETREKTALLAMQEFELTQDLSKLEVACLSAIEYSTSEVAASWVQRLASAGQLAKVRFKGIEAYQKLMAGELETLRTFCQETLTPEERILSGYLKGKSVAIVAPAPGEQLNGAEIDSFDVVIRLNSLKNPMLDAQARHGSRTDISAFNDTKAVVLSTFSGGVPISLADGVKFVLCKQHVADFSGRDLVSVVKRDGKKTATGYVREPINHIPHLAYYLLGFPVAKIKIFNSNFFLSRKTHEAAYGRVPMDLSILVFWDSQDASHRLVSRLLSLKLIEADQEAGEVLSLATQEYMSRMQELYVR